jgi:hypothetical protein
MALPGLGDLLEVAIVHTLGPVDEQINVFHMHVAVAGTGTDADLDADLLEYFGDAYALIEHLMPTSMDVQEIRYRNVTDNTPTRYVPWTGTYTGGTSTGEHLPPACAALILYRTGVLKVLGKKYLPTFSEAAQDGGVWSAGTLGSVGAFGGATDGQVTMPVTNIELEFRVFSRTLGNDYPIIGAQARSQVAYLRSRRFGRGS